MSVNIETAISFLKTKIGHTTYSMYGSRNFSDGTCDCSGAVYTALRKGGASNLGYIASTETLHGWLISNGFKLIAENSDWSMKRGDVVIWGKKGASAGAGGHTGICVDGQNWLECTAYRNLGETQQNHDVRWSMNGGPYFYVYRYTGKVPASTPTKPKPATKGAVPTDVIYALHKKGGAWLGDVKNFDGTDNGYAGYPNTVFDLLTMRVTHGSIRYRVHEMIKPQSVWEAWVTKSDKNDTVNGCAGEVGVAIDGVQIYYTTPNGETYQQAYYRSQTTERAGWLNVVCDDADFAGEYGEPLDHLQVTIGTHDPY